MPYKDPEKRRQNWRKHYLKNKKKNKLRVRQRSDMIKSVIQQIKDTPCFDCKQEYPHFVLDLHHEGKKTDNLSVAYRDGWGINKIVKELKECIVLCSNCHRLRTHS